MEEERKEEKREERKMEWKAIDAKDRIKGSSLFFVFFCMSAGRKEK